MIKSKKTVLILTLVVSLLLPTTAYAYNILSYGYVTAHRNVNVISIRSNSTYRSAYDSSVNDWQNAIRGVKFTQSISSNYINRVTVADTWYGIYRAYNRDIYGRAHRFTIDINANRVPNNSNFIKSVIAHELGHSLGLDHNQDRTSIMSYNRDRYTIVKPNSDDVRGVKFFYGL